MIRKFYLELRRREVFRTAGLYTGIAWIIIEVADVLLPTLGLPDSVLRWLVIIALAGFPIMLVLAWIFDVTDEGVVVQGDVADVAVPVGGRRMDFLVIGVLSVALFVSLYLNFARSGDVERPLTAVAIVAPDAGDSDAVIAALLIGLADAPRVAAALSVDGPAAPISHWLEAASACSARANTPTLQVSMSGPQQDLSLQLEWRIPDGGVEARADGEGAWLAAVGDAVAGLRRELGEPRDAVAVFATSGWAGTVSPQALSSGLDGLRAACRQDHAAAEAAFAAAVAADPGFRAAWAALAATQVRAGGSGSEAWRQVLALPADYPAAARDTALAAYFGKGDAVEAIAALESRLEAYPADATALALLAGIYAETSRFDAALAASSRWHALRGGDPAAGLYHARLAVLAGRPAVATPLIKAAQGAAGLKAGAGRLEALAALAAGDTGQARAMLQTVREQWPVATALALADLALAEGDAAAAEAALADAGVDALASVLRAELAMLRGEPLAAVELLPTVMPRQDSARLPMAAVLVGAGRYAEAQELANALRAAGDPRSRAFASLIEGQIALARGEALAAVRLLREGQARADHWLLRLYLGIAYLDAGYTAEALGEFAACRDRRREAVDLFLDGTPGWRYTALLERWQSAASALLESS